MGCATVRLRYQVVCPSWGVVHSVTLNDHIHMLNSTSTTHTPTVSRRVMGGISRKPEHVAIVAIDSARYIVGVLQNGRECRGLQQGRIGVQIVGHLLGLRAWPVGPHRGIEALSLGIDQLGVAGDGSQVRTATTPGLSFLIAQAFDVQGCRRLKFEIPPLHGMPQIGGKVVFCESCTHHILVVSEPPSWLWNLAPTKRPARFHGRDVG